MILIDSLFVYSLYLLSMLKLCGAYYFPIDLGECQDDHVTCTCGVYGREIRVSIKRCSVFHRWNRTCVPCEPFDKVTLCEQYRFCSECSGVLGEVCKSCPGYRYGKTCQNECHCKNGGTCDQYSGICSCPPNYTGSKCEKKTGLDCTHPTVPFNGLVEVGSFVPGSLAKYKCKDNFVLIGSATRRCMENGKWSDGVPSCEYSCLLPMMRDHIRIEVKPVLIQPPGETKAAELVRQAIFSCDDGYGIIGLATLTCLPTGKWNADIPVCEKTCGAAPDVPNSQIFGSGKFEGDSVKYKCNEGFEMKGQSVLKCTGGFWGTAIPKCEKLIVCKQPQRIPNGGFTSENDHFGLSATVTYYCDPQFTMRGTAIRSCLSSGEWSGEQPWCERSGISSVCPRPLIPEHGDVVHIQYIPAFTAGMKIRYKCKEGYIVSGQRDRECLENGTWSDQLPRCVKVLMCDDPGIPKNAIINVIKPPSGYSRRGWRLPSFAFPKSNATADTTTFEDTGLKLPKGKHEIFTKIQFDCESRFYKLVGSHQRTCRASREWSGRQPACVPVCGVSPTPRLPLIINGSVSYTGQWPWQAAVSYNATGGWDIHCAGSLVDENWVVTAAHCVTERRRVYPRDKSTMKIYLGKHYRDSSKDDDSVKVREISEIVVHPDFTPNFLDSDIALLRLKKPVRLSERIMPICLPDKYTSEVHLRPGSSGIVTGWGMKEDGDYSDELRMTSVQTITNEDCETKYAQVNRRQVITDSMFCAGHDDGHADACTGDSGGPLAFSTGSGDEKRWYLEGIVSWGGDEGMDCGSELQYGGYTKVARFVEWIHHTI